MAKARKAGTLFIFDEPTTGLHFYDMERVVWAFNELIEQGHSIIVIEHNMEVVKCGDHIIDLGPEGGGAGGEIIAKGTPEQIAKVEQSYTGVYLRPYLKDKASPFTPVLEKNLETRHAVPAAADSNAIAIVGAKEHNLKNISLNIPRDRFVVFIGLSGSGNPLLNSENLSSDVSRTYLA